MEAVRRKRGGLVSLLLEQPDIQVNAKNKDNWTALHFVVQAQHTTKHSTKKMIQSLLNFPGINTEIANDRGETPLMMATRENNKYFIKVYQKKMGEEKTSPRNPRLIQQKRVCRGPRKGREKCATLHIPRLICGRN